MFFCSFAEGLFKEMMDENFTYVEIDLKIEFKKLIGHPKIWTQKNLFQEILC